MICTSLAATSKIELINWLSNHKSCDIIEVPKDKFVLIAFSGQSERINLNSFMLYSEVIF